MRRWLVRAGFVATVAAAPACGKKADAPAAPAATAGAAVAPGETPEQTAEKKAVEEVAKASLTAYRDKNIERLAELGPPGAKDKTIFIEPRNPNYERLLGDSTWRMRALKAWNGELAGMRIGTDVAQVRFADHPDNKGQVVAVELVKIEGKWRFHDLIEQDRGLYTHSTISFTLPTADELKKARAEAAAKHEGAAEAPKAGEAKVGGDAPAPAPEGAPTPAEPAPTAP